MKSAHAGLFEPRWSIRILEEWARATRKLGPGAEEIARGEIAILNANWPRCSVPEAPGLTARLWLPDENDIHVLATAVHSSADVIITVNAKDFPRGVLAEEGLERRDPDGFLWQLHSTAPEIITGIVEDVHSEAERLSGSELPLRALLKRARLPKLAKAITT